SHSPHLLRHHHHLCPSHPSIQRRPLFTHFFQRYADHRYLHSFPTRRSSDLKEDYKSFFNTEYNIKRLGSEGVRLIIEKIDRNKYGRSTEPREVNVEEASIAESYKKLFNLVTTTILTLLVGFVILIVIMIMIL